MEKLVFATNNAHKLQEVREILGGRFEILSLADIGCREEIPETGATLRENARQKAAWVKERYGYDCFADDTGLEVRALGGAPGVYSARYSGPDATYESNNRKLLRELEGATDRRAAFRTVICLILGREEHYFTGEVQGTIVAENRGAAGFGYDPLFVPEGYELTYAELGEELKNRISHRAQATGKLVDYLLGADR